MEGELVNFLFFFSVPGEFAMGEAGGGRGLRY